MEKALEGNRQKGFSAEVVSGAQTAEAIKRRTLRILLLEDVASDAELIQRELRRSDIAFESRCVQRKGDFIACLQEFHPDVILSDYSMPQFNAVNALEILREIDGDIPFILVTGSQSEEVAVDCMKRGADDYILKTSLKRLPSAVLNSIERREAGRHRRRALSELQAREEHFRSLIENALDIIVVLNPDGAVRYASPSVHVLGYSPKDLSRRNLLDMISQDDVREARRLFQEVLQFPDQTRKIEFVIQHKDGSWRVVEAIGKCIRPHSEDAAVVLNARDVTERKEHEAAIEKLAAFPRLNPNPFLEIGADGQVEYYNGAAAEMARSIGKEHPAEILPPETQEILDECFHSGKCHVQREAVIGHRILSWSFFPVLTSQAVHCYGVDMTERINLESQLRQSQKMESIGQLAAGVAHDFNNILTVIKGYSGLLLERKELTEDVQEPLREIAIVTDRAAGLTRQLLMFSRKQMIEPVRLDLNEAISNISRLLRRIIGEQITLHFEYTPNLPPVEADPGMFEQIVMNLAVNARDAMPRGGDLEIGTALCRINDVHVRINPEARKGYYVCLRISDSGSGIAPHVLPHIFEPFFTTKEVGKGTGLGLATVYGIVKQHQGWIEVLSQLDKGSTFRVYLPAAVSADELEQRPEPELKVRGGDETILLVEDEPELRALVRSILRHKGYHVLEAGSGPEALPVWEEHAEKIDLLLTDMVMPGDMTGRELAEILKNKKPNLKVVYTSGYSVDMIGKGLVLKRGVNFLPKPYPPDALARIVRDSLDRKA